MMLRFDPPERLAPVLERVERFYREAVQPLEERLAERLGDSGRYLDERGLLHPEVWEARREIYRRSGEAGLYSLHLPGSVGGGGLGREDMLYVEEAVFRKGLGLNPAILSWSDGATPRLLYMDDSHLERFGRPLARGEITCAHAITEPGAGSDWGGLAARAEFRGGRWVLNGQKAPITNFAYADVANVLAVTDPGAGRRTWSYFQFDTAEFRGKGYRPGKVWQTMFQDGFTGEILLEDLELPGGALLGERGQGFDIALCSINWTRIRRGGMCSGWGAYLIEQSVERAKRRRVAGGLLGTKQGVQWMIADMYADWFAARSLSLEAARRADHPGPWYKMPKSREEVREFCLVKLFNDEAFCRIADRAAQIFGALGVMEDHPVSKLFRIARNFRIPGGSDEVMRNSIAESFGLGGKA